MRSEHFHSLTPQLRFVVHPHRGTGAGSSRTDTKFRGSLKTAPSSQKDDGEGRRSFGQDVRMNDRAIPPPGRMLNFTVRRYRGIGLEIETIPDRLFWPTRPEAKGSHANSKIWNGVSELESWDNAGRVGCCAIRAWSRTLLGAVAGTAGDRCVGDCKSSRSME